ncbi:MAG: NADH-quinone oxidoreductase subunit G [Propionibacteriaceae bacterium]|jgi:NADH-quinone oxidoreductase subunit G|nr:NADH-quinone oxidoreductase subunit G [Propionibacteriaceae bacterium]
MTQPVSEAVTFTIDDVTLTVPKGTNVIRAAEASGIEIPRFCDHPLLDPVAACRQCMVDVVDAGNGRPMKPQPACALEAAKGMVVRTAATSDVAKQAQCGMLEFLLINHPLDCPECDKAGECPLQNQARVSGRETSRYTGAKRTFPKPIMVGQTLLLDRERCVLCQRCIRFADQISGDSLLALVERGGKSQIGAHPDAAFGGYFAGNVAQICPVGALTTVDYRFQSRPFDLVSEMSTCENCAAGCEMRVDARAFEVKRRLAGNDSTHNDEWLCDKGRFACRSARGADRLTTPLVRGTDGRLHAASWPEALAAAAAGLASSATQGAASGVLTGGRLTLENAYAYSKFARTVLQTNNIDCRVRYLSDEETAWMMFQQTTGLPPVTYETLDAANHVVLVDFEPEEECPMVFLRLRKAVRKRGIGITAIAPYLSHGNAKLGAGLLACAPGGEAAALRGLTRLGDNTVILVGERAATSPGTLTLLSQLASTRQVKVGWIPRRAGELGAVAAGCLPTLLPAGRQTVDVGARSEFRDLWKVSEFPNATGFNASNMLIAAAAGAIKSLVIAGVDLADLPDPNLAVSALQTAFVISLEVRESEVSAFADVVFPVAPLEQQEGTFIDWTHAQRKVVPVDRHDANPLTDLRVLGALASAMGVDLNLPNPKEALRELHALATRPVAAVHMSSATPPPIAWSEGNVILATWRPLIDDGRCLDGADSLRRGAPKVSVKMSPATATGLGISPGEHVELSAHGTRWHGPVELVVGMAEGVVWIPQASGASVHGRLIADSGERVTLSAGGGVL